MPTSANYSFTEVSLIFKHFAKKYELFDDVVVVQVFGHLASCKISFSLDIYFNNWVM